MITITNSDEVMDLIDTIASTPGKNDKTELLRGADCALLRQVLTAALDPLTTYGISKLPDRDDPTGDDGVFDDQTWQLIEGMAARRITGGNMQNEVWAEFNRLSPASADLLGRILIKDLAAGFGDNTTNKAIPGLIREFPYMRCSLPKPVVPGKHGKPDKPGTLDAIDWSAGVVSQEKADAMFINVNHVAGGQVMLFSRAGTMFPSDAFGALVNDIRLAIPEDNQLHGELMVLKFGKLLPREECNGILNSVAQGGRFEADEIPIIMAWDLVPLEFIKPKGKCEIGYLRRLKNLTAGLAKLGSGAHLKVIPTRIVRSKAEAYDHYRTMLAHGKEGTILKLPNAIWKDGTSTEQLKLKLEAEVDLKVVAIVPGDANGKNAGRAGSLTCETSCGGLRVNVAVKGEKMRDEIDADHSAWIGGIMPVLANSIMKPSDSNNLHSLFLPRFSQASIRTDKTVPDSLQRVVDQFEAAVKAA